MGVSAGNLRRNANLQLVLLLMSITGGSQDLGRTFPVVYIYIFSAPSSNCFSFLIKTWARPFYYFPFVFHSHLLKSEKCTLLFHCEATLCLNYVLNWTWVACPLSRTNSLTMPATATQGKYFATLIPIATNILNWIYSYIILFNYYLRFA